VPRSSAPRWRRVLVPRFAQGLLVGSLLSLGVAAAEPVFHEFIDLGPGRDPVEPVVTGQYPALPSGKAAAGSSAAAGSAPGAAERAGPAGSLSDAGLSPGAPFSIDRDTTRPSRV